MHWATDETRRPTKKWHPSRSTEAGNTDGIDRSQQPVLLDINPSRTIRVRSRDGPHMNHKRITLSLPERTVERLESLKDATSATSVTDVVKQAIMMHEAIIKHLQNGLVFYALKPDGSRIEVEFMVDVEVKKTPHQPGAKVLMTA